MSRALLFLLLIPPPAQGSRSPNLVAPLRVVGDWNASPRLLHAPGGADVGPDGLLYVADSGRHRVRVFGPDGVPRREWGGPDVLRFPADVAVDARGQVYVADAARVRVFDAEGRPLREWPAVAPAAVAVADDRVAVAEPDLHRVRVFTLEGRERAALGGLNGPAGVAFDPSKRLYVSDALNHRIRVFDAEGRPAADFGSHGAFSGFLNHPAGLAFAHGRLYVADRGNHRIQVFDPSGALRHQWGGGPLKPHQAEGRLHAPRDIAVAAGFAVVVEPLEDRLQLFPPGDVVGAALVDAPWWERSHNRAPPGADAPAPPTPDPGLIAAAVDPDAHALFFVEVVPNRASRLIARAGGFGARLGLFNRPEAVVYDPARRRAYVSDRGHRRVQAIDLVGERPRAREAVDLPALTGREHATPGALALDGSGRLYALDTAAGELLVFGEGLKLQRSIKLPDDGRWEAVAASADGASLHLADARGGRIAIFSADGRLQRAWGGPDVFPRISGVAVDASGAVHVSDAVAHEIRTFGPDGAPLRVVAGSGTEPGRVRSPGHLSPLPSGRLVVDDAGNHLGQLFTADGKSWGFFVKAGFPFFRSSR